MVLAGSSNSFQDSVTSKFLEKGALLIIKKGRERKGGGGEGRPDAVSQQSKLQSQSTVADFAICVSTNQIRNNVKRKGLFFA